MSAQSANCPSCGASIEFRWSGAVQTTCEFCSSILIRHDLDLEKVGEVSEPPPVTSLIQLGTSGSYDGRSFQVVGRIAYSWERGGWSEWHIVFSDGASGWLSDAQAEYAVTFLADDVGRLPRLDDIRPGTPLRQSGGTFEVTSITDARYVGVEGELPFEYWDHEEVRFADLKSHDGRLATLDYSDEEPMLFVGEYVDFDGLRLSGLREEDEETAEQVRALNCPNCGGGVTILHAPRAVNVVCESCGSVLDARSPSLEVLQKFEGKRRIKPHIPLGSKGQLGGHEYEVLGFQVRAIVVEGTTYSWREYLLFNPQQGNRYLSEYDGHWNDIVTLRSLPKVAGHKRPLAELHGERFKHFQTATAKTKYVLGEFPWQIRVGDKVRADDYVSPPRMLSCETTENERTWSLGEYTAPEEIWKAFGLKGSPPRRSGVFANQPSPHAGSAKRNWLTLAALVVMFAGLALVRVSLPNSTRVLSEPLVFDSTQPDSSVVVLGPFTLEGRPSNLQVALETNVNNAWVYFTISLLNVDTGETFDFGREVSFYHGRDGGEAWSEGSRDERPRIPSVPAGQYMLRIMPEGPTTVQYRATLRRDVPAGWHFLFALILLATPAIYTGVRAGTFEHVRWQESDYAVETD